MKRCRCTAWEFDPKCEEGKTLFETLRDLEDEDILSPSSVRREEIFKEYQRAEALYIEHYTERRSK